MARERRERRARAGDGDGTASKGRNPRAAKNGQQQTTVQSRERHRLRASLSERAPRLCHPRPHPASQPRAAPDRRHRAQSLGRVRRANMYSTSRVSGRHCCRPLAGVSRSARLSRARVRFSVSRRRHVIRDVFPQWRTHLAGVSAIRYQAPVSYVPKCAPARPPAGVAGLAMRARPRRRPSSPYICPRPLYNRSDLAVGLRARQWTRQADATSRDMPGLWHCCK